VFDETDYYGAKVKDLDTGLLAGQSILVTGAASGIGRACALGVVRYGGKLAATDINEKGLKTLEEAVGSEQCITIPADVGASGDSIVREAVARCGELTGAITSAGVHKTGYLGEISTEDYDRVVSANMRGTFLVCRELIDYWGTSCGRLVTVASRTGLYPQARSGAPYAAAKAGVVALSLAIAEELVGTGISINVVCPRARTPMNTAGIGSNGLQGQDELGPDRVVPGMLYLASLASGWCSGQVFAIDADRLQWLHGWTHGSGVRKGEPWTLHDMDAAFKRLVGALPPGTDDGFARYADSYGVAARGRSGWKSNVTDVSESQGQEAGRGAAPPR
jgi:NAD(P)-dependent dehydrogenase (short-subunit alcohol dehydrogenase family)